MKNPQGFTLIELMIVIFIIGVLAAIAVPNYMVYKEKAFYCEAYELADGVRKNINRYYEHRGIFPTNNTEAGVAGPESIKGKYVDRVQVSEGEIGVHFNHRVPEKMRKKAFVLQAAIIKGNPTGPVIWFRKDIKEEIPQGLKPIVGGGR